MEAEPATASYEVFQSIVTSKLYVRSSAGLVWRVPGLATGSPYSKREVAATTVQLDDYAQYRRLVVPDLATIGFTDEPLPPRGSTIPRPRKSYYRPTGGRPGRASKPTHELQNCPVSVGLTVAEYKAFADAAHAAGRTVPEHVRAILTASLDPEELAAMVVRFRDDQSV